MTCSDSIPYFYYEISSLLLAECSDEFENPKQVRSLIEDLFELRREKVLRQLKSIDLETPVVYLSTAGSAELNYLRPGF